MLNEKRIEQAKYYKVDLEVDAKLYKCTLG